MVNEPLVYLSQSKAIFAGVFLFLALSAGNALGGIYQYLIILLSSMSLFYYRMQAPKFLMFMCLMASVIWGTISMGFEASTASFIINALKFIRPTLEGFGIAITLFYYFKIRNSSQFVQVVSWYCIIMALSMIVMIVSPELKKSWLDVWYSGDDYGDIVRRTILFRAWGVSKHHLFGLPLALGMVFVLIVMGLQKGSRQQSDMLMFIGAFSALLVIIPNARIGLVPVILVFFISIVIFLRAVVFKFFLKLFLLAVLLILFIVFYFNSAEFLRIIVWIFAAFKMFFISSNEPTTISDLGGMLHFPNSVKGWIIGQNYICPTSQPCYSDIGWIRTLQYGGLLATTLIIAIYLPIAWQISTLFNDNKSIRSKKVQINLFVVVLITLAVAFTKGDFYATSDFSRLLMTIAFLTHQFDTKRKKERFDSAKIYN